MAMSKLQLNVYKLNSLHVESKQLHDPDNFKEFPEADLKVQFNIHKNPDRYEFVVPIDIILTWSSEMDCPFDRISVSLFGVFSLPDTMPEDEVRKYVPLLCLTNLFGIARGIISQVTANFNGGPFILPLVNMGDIIQGVVAEMEESKQLSSDSSE